MVICLERGADLRMAQLMSLPLTVSCFSKVQIGSTFLHLGSPGKGPLNGCVRACVCACARLRIFVAFISHKNMRLVPYNVPGPRCIVPPVPPRRHSGCKHIFDAFVLAFLSVRNENSIISESAKSAQPASMLPPGESSWVYARLDGKGGRTNRHQTNALSFPLWRCGQRNNNFVFCSSYLIVSFFVFLLVSYAVY